MDVIEFCVFAKFEMHFLDISFEAAPDLQMQNPTHLFAPNFHLGILLLANFRQL